ncbi:small VCP/p97-interacting protein [Prorops nasuta]|uniref:small VCP/p97-interacting protein n=1 Tax=Prorops nasuta TaxID=863751 RepID=UPI0034CD48F8
MGNLCGFCCKEESYEDLTPDVETRRRQQVEAAEKRLADQEHRGIKNVDAVRRQQQRALERDKLEQQTGNAGTQNPLRWQVE